jgi:hypothetical protein
MAQASLSTTLWSHLLHARHRRQRAAITTKGIAHGRPSRSPPGELRCPKAGRERLGGDIVGRVSRIFSRRNPTGVARNVGLRCANLTYGWRLFRRVTLR